MLAAAVVAGVLVLFAWALVVLALPTPGPDDVVDWERGDYLGREDLETADPAEADEAAAGLA